MNFGWNDWHSWHEFWVNFGCTVDTVDTVDTNFGVNCVNCVNCAPSSKRSPFAVAMNKIHTQTATTILCPGASPALRSPSILIYMYIYIYYIYTYWYCNLAPKYIQIPQGSTRLGTISTEHGPNNLNPTAISCDHPCWGPFPISTSKAQKLHIKTRSLLWIILMQNDFLQSVFRGNGPRKKLVGKSMVQKRVLTQPQFPVSRYHSSFLSKASPSRSGSGPGLMMYKETMSVNLEAGEKIVRMW